MDELNELLAEELDAFLDEERVDLPSTPPDETQSFFWDSTPFEVSGDEGDGDNETTLKLEDEDEEGNASGTFAIPLRGRAPPLQHRSPVAGCRSRFRR